MNLSQVRRAVWLRRLSDASQSRFTLLKNHHKHGQLPESATSSDGRDTRAALKWAARPSRVRSTYHYKSCRSGQAALEQRIKEICHVCVRYGYRRIHIVLRREGWHHGQNKTRRVYRELGLQLRNKTPKRRVKAKLRDDRRPATRSNETWAMDFVHNQLATGRRLRVLTIVDIVSRFSPALAPTVHLPRH